MSTLQVDDEPQEVVVTQVEPQVLEVITQAAPQVLEVATATGPRGPQGPVGPQGPKGDPGDTSGALLALNHLGEFDTEQKREQARANLGLQTIDGGTFF